MVVRMSAKRTYYRCVYGGLASLALFGVGNGIVQGHKLESGCKRSATIVVLSWPADRYPNIRAHWLATLHGTGRTHRKWPSVYVLRRSDAPSRRAKLMRLDGLTAKPGYDRDEQPPAFGRSIWRADLAYVPSAENRSHGASMGAKLRGYCEGTRFRFRWTR
jgi:hypothetical protein